MGSIVGPDLAARVALMQAVIDRAPDLVADAGPVTAADFAQAWFDGVPAEADLTVGGVAIESDSRICTVGAGGGDVRNAPDFGATWSDGDSDWRLSTDFGHTYLSRRDGDATAAWVFSRAPIVPDLGHGTVTYGPLLTSAAIDATLVLDPEPNKPHTIPDAPAEITVQGTITCGPPVS